MSGYALIYDKAGVDSFCLSAAYDQIKSLIDDRSYRVEYLSEKPNAIDDSPSNPVRLFVIPGGNYRVMAPELAPLASRIQKLVTEDGASYLGLCAGAIAAARTPLLVHYEELVPDALPDIQVMEEVASVSLCSYLELYSGICSILTVPGSTLYGTQQVCKVGSELEEAPYPLYFQEGVFFPGAEHEPGAQPLLKYARLKFSGFYQPRGRADRVYHNIDPIAAVTQKAGAGRLLLSGVHPEIGTDVVANVPADKPWLEKAKAKALDSLSKSPELQVSTMRDYLNTLSIGTKV